MWTNAVVLLIWPSRADFSEIVIEIYIVLFKNMHLKILPAKRHLFCLGLNVLMCSAAIVEIPGIKKGTIEYMAGRFNIRITSNRYGEFNEACCLVTVCFVLRCRVVTALHFISRSIKCRWSLRVLHLHISCSDMTKHIEKNGSIQSGISYIGKTASLLSNVPVVCIALSISCLHQTQTQIQTGVYST